MARAGPSGDTGSMSQAPYDPYAHDRRYDDRAVGYGHQPDTAGPDDRAPAILAHLSSLIGMVATAGWLSFVGPLLVWFLYKDRSPFVRQAAAGSFNFNIGMWIMSIVGWICILTLILIPVGIVLLIMSSLGQIICHILGTMRASRGRTFRYPFRIRLLR